MVPLEKVEEEMHAVLKTNDQLCRRDRDSRRQEGGAASSCCICRCRRRTPQQVCKELSERGLPNIYIPGHSDFFQVAELPILGSGKLDLKKCKQMALDLAKDKGEPPA